MAEFLPIECEATALSLFIEDGAGRYARRAALPFRKDA